MERFCCNLSRREEETLLKATKERALKECDDYVKAFAECAKGRLVSLSWACRTELRAMQSCMYEFTCPESMEKLQKEYVRLRTNLNDSQH